MPAFNKILDTFLFENGEIHLKEFHIDRVFETYSFLKTKVTRADIAIIYDVITKQLQSENGSQSLQNPSRPQSELIRVMFDPVRPHKHTVEVKELDSLHVPVRLVISETATAASETSQFKFADRKDWDLLLKSKPFDSDDVLLARDGHLIETSRFNLFLHVERENLVMTPTLNSGCLNGVLRRSLLQKGRVALPGHNEVKIIERDFTIETAATNILYVGNSVRGLLPSEIL